MDRRYDPKLNKKRYLTHADCTVYTVNGFAVRNASQADEEFGNFGCHDEFPDAIGGREVWVSEKLAAREGVFFTTNALTYLARVAAGATDRAYDEGIDAERALRESINGLEYRDGKPHKRVPDAVFLDEYVVLPDPKGTVSVRLVDGNLARSYYKTDYTWAGRATSTRGCRGRRSGSRTERTTGSFPSSFVTSTLSGAWCEMAAWNTTAPTRSPRPWSSTCAKGRG